MIAFDLWYTSVACQGASSKCHRMTHKSNIICAQTALSVSLVALAGNPGHIEGAVCVKDVM